MAYGKFLGAVTVLIFLNTFVLYFHLEHVQGRIDCFVAVSLFLIQLFFVLMMALFYG